MNIKYHTTAYVLCSRAMLDALDNTINGWARGNESLCVTVEDIADMLDDTSIIRDDMNPEVARFLTETLKHASGKAGDVIFHK